MRARTPTLTLAALLTGCELERAPPPPEVEPSEVGAHFEIYRERPERELCAGSMAYLDRFIERAFEVLDAPLPADLRIPIRIVDEAPCPWHTCYWPADRTVYIESLNPAGQPFEHLRRVLALAAVDHAWGRGLPFYEQGLAEAFAARHDGPYELEDFESVLDSLDRPDDMVDDAVAARFIRYLIDTRGVDRFRQLFQSGAKRTQASARAAIERVHGEDPDLIVDQFTSGPGFCRHRIDICDPERGVEPVGAAWSSEITYACDEPRAHGVRQGDGRGFFVLRTLEVETSGRYRLRASEHVLASPRGERRPRMLLEDCGGCDGDVSVLYNPDALKKVGLDLELELEAGRYSLQVGAWDGVEMDVELEYLGDVAP